MEPEFTDSRGLFFFYSALISLLRWELKCLVFLLFISKTKVFSRVVCKYGIKRMTTYLENSTLTYRFGLLRFQG